jgi:hypothetical protein
MVMYTMYTRLQMMTITEVNEPCKRNGTSGNVLTVVSYGPLCIPIPQAVTLHSPTNSISSQIETYGST